VAGPAGALLVAVALAAVTLAGCDDKPDLSPGALEGSPREGGTLAYALDERLLRLDPLEAESRAEQVVTRQVHEPLVDRLAGPFGDVRRLPGLAESARPTGGGRVWRLRLRRRVRFQDGTHFGARAVLANANRWQSSGIADRLLPGLIAVDAPAPDVVRFILTGPDPRVPERLASPQLGIVSPRALRSGNPARTVREPGAGTGTGPFALREREHNRIVVGRSPSWWGTGHDLGPGLDQIEFRVVADDDERLALLRSGEVQVAEGLGRRQVSEAARDPLLMILEGRAGALGLERSVRGIDSADEVVSLSGAWLTRIGAGS
jgi:peptide/nickel transport system substrate-binding protein